MIAKKNPRYDLERKRIVLFQIGLLTAGSFTLAAFTYRSPVQVDDEKKKVAHQSVSFEVEEKKEIPKLDLPIQKQQFQDRKEESSSQQINIERSPSDLIIETGDKTKSIDPNVGLDGLTIKTGIDIIIPIEEVEGEVFDIVDVDATYIGGYAEMMKYIQSNLSYPQDAIELNEQGKVYVSFVVDTDGSVKGVQVERGVSKSIDREAARIVRSFPKWIPGELNYSKVKTRVRLPINFVLE
ncbi:MAG: energy transducer TonB [Crocinitomicaceae bacterium]|jgi:protein TonB|nr:energy transducer TonB [Crocinitomicaceae bacterium]MCF8433794.1 energy transducer TonB [Crocinitomicaceae bacterium]